MRASSHDPKPATRLGCDTMPIQVFIKSTAKVHRVPATAIYLSSSRSGPSTSPVCPADSRDMQRIAGFRASCARGADSGRVAGPLLIGWSPWVEPRRAYEATVRHARARCSWD